ncbi:MAG: winged helix-turn-helix domain-containing protein [Myxococcota bacterium]|jgi:hypothetical protein|nr:winged helix-turn-helix domain-containing protein [Myxococcota bacterium]
MTFYQAAITVLRSVGRPLHYKKITELAIKSNLLSHIGKTPEITMAARLLREIERSPRESLLIRPRQGVYALRNWPQAEENSVEVLSPETPIETQTSPDASETEVPSEEVSVSSEEVKSSEEPRRRRKRRKRKRRDEGTEGTEQEAAPSIAPLRSDELVLSVEIIKCLREKSIPMDIAEIAEHLSRSYPTVALTPTSILLAIQADNRQRRAQYRRAAVQVDAQGRCSLSEWSLSKVTLKLEARLYDCIRQLRLHAISAISARLAALKPELWLQLMVLLVKQRGLLLEPEAERLELGWLLHGQRSMGLGRASTWVLVCEESSFDFNTLERLQGLLRERDLGAGMVILNGEFEDRLVEDQRLAVEFWDRKLVAKHLCELGMGSSQQVLVAQLPEPAFFDALVEFAGEPG